MVEPAAPLAPQQGGENEGGAGSILTFVSRMLLIYLVVTAMGPRSPQKLEGDVDVVDGVVQPADPTAAQAASPPAPSKEVRHHFPLWADHQPFELYFFVTEKKVLTGEIDKKNATWVETDLTYDQSESNYRAFNYTFETSDSLRNNGSLYAHIFLAKPKAKLTTAVMKDVVYVRGELTKYKLKKKEVILKSLLGGDVSDNADASLTADHEANTKKDDSTAVTAAPDKDAPVSSGDVIVSYLKPRLDAVVVVDQMVMPEGQILPHVRKHYTIEKKSNGYLPPVLASDFWVMDKNLIPLNETVKEATVELYFNTRSRLMFEMEVQMVMSWDQQDSMGMMTGRDQIKEMLLETNPYLLAVTAFVSVLHSIFDILAFKNDIQFWRNKKSVEGLSVRSILLNVFCQAVIFLYLCDNDTSWVILISCGVGLLIEMWKVKKSMNVNMYKVNSMIPWRIALVDKDSYKSETKEHDETAMRYLSYIMYPGVAGYAIYSLVYNTHKSWYSWVLSSLVGTVYMFGFIMMTPQLFINYKLKSVAHLPWRVFVYKALNTFVDDLFAFVIKMPTMHRLACFRDDLIFFIFLYQRWIYRVDMSRANEFGQVFEDDEGRTKEEVEKLEKEKKEGKPATIEAKPKDPVQKKED